MTAAEAIANLRTDLAELEARNVVRPGLIAAKRSWVDTVDHEMKHLQQEVEQLKHRCNQEHEERLQAELRTGMLANVLTIMGFSPWQHLRCPLDGLTYSNPDVYMLAAQQQEERDRAQGLSGRIHLVGDVFRLNDLLYHALWHARYTIMLSNIGKYLPPTHGQEQRPAA